MTSLHIGPLPGRKSICLSLTEDAVVTPLAYFRSEAEAKKALEFLDGAILHEVTTDDWHGYRRED